MHLPLEFFEKSPGREVELVVAVHAGASLVRDEDPEGIADRLRVHIIRELDERGRCDAGADLFERVRAPALFPRPLGKIPYDGLEDAPKRLDGVDKRDAAGIGRARARREERLEGLVECRTLVVVQVGQRAVLGVPDGRREDAAARAREEGPERGKGEYA